MTDSQNQRQFERLPSSEPATLIMSDGRTYAGETRDMGMGGYLFVPDEEPQGLTQGEEGRIDVEVFLGRVTSLPCKILHIGERGVGVEIKRYYPAPD